MKDVISKLDNILYAMDYSLEGIFIENLKGDILKCNRAGANMFGYTIEEITKLNITNFVPEDEKYYLNDEYSDRDLFPNQYIRRAILKKDGTLIQTEVNSKIINVDAESYLIAFIRPVNAYSGIDPRDPKVNNFDSLFNRITEEENNRVLCLYDSWGNQKHIVPLRTVEYIESDLKKLKVHSTKGIVLEGYGTMNKLEEQIPIGGRFIRCFQSFIVNMQYANLNEEQQLFMMNSGANILIRKRGFRKTKDAFYRYKILTK